MYTLEVDLLCFSMGGDEHPLAKESTLVAKTVLHEEPFKYEMTMEIRKGLLVVLIKPKHWHSIVSEMGMDDDHELLVFDWKTGQEIAVRVISRAGDQCLDIWPTMQCLIGQGTVDFRLPLDQVIVVANQSLAALELYTLPVPKSDTGLTPMMRIAVLALPSLEKGWRITRLTFSNCPTKNIVSSEVHDASIFAKPFTSASPDYIIFITLRVDNGFIFEDVSFIVHSSTLECHALSVSHAALQDAIPWQMWGPTATRWCPYPTDPPPNLFGQRYLTDGPSSKEIWDFNQYRVRYLGRGYTVESEAACVSVETEPSCATSIGLLGGAYSSLPYVKLVLKELVKYGHGTCLDDDRIFIRRVSLSRSSLLQFFF